MPTGGIALEKTRKEQAALDITIFGAPKIIFIIEKAEAVLRYLSAIGNIYAKLVLRQKMLDDANATITEAKHRLAEMKYEHSRMKDVLGEDRDLQSIQLQRNMLATFISMLVCNHG